MKINDPEKDIEQGVEKKYAARDAKKKKKMAVTGKSVFALQALMQAHKEKRFQLLNKKARS